MPWADLFTCDRVIAVAAIAAAFYVAVTLVDHMQERADIRNQALIAAIRAAAILKP
jgi:hypothetical protein